MLRAILISLCLAGAARADGGYQTARGLAQILPEPGSDGARLDLVIGGEIVVLGWGAAPAQLWIEAQRDALLLIGSSNDAACPAVFRWVTVEDSGFAVSDTFGTCAKGPQIRVGSLGVTVRLAGWQGTPQQDFFYDGVRITATPVGQ